jgi:hypothetical protein
MNIACDEESSLDVILVYNKDYGNYTLTVTVNTDDYGVDEVKYICSEEDLEVLVTYLENKMTNKK